MEPTPPKPKQPVSCFTCNALAYQPCYVAGEFEPGPHCRRWYPDATGCTDYVREPGSDDE